MHTYLQNLQSVRGTPNWTFFRIWMMSKGGVSSIIISLLSVCMVLDKKFEYWLFYLKLIGLSAYILRMFLFSCLCGIVFIFHNTTNKIEYFYIASFTSDSSLKSFKITLHSENN